MYSRYAKAKFLGATGRTGSRVRVSVYSPNGEREHRVVQPLDYSKSFREQVRDILAELGINAGMPQVAAISAHEELWIL